MTTPLFVEGNASEFNLEEDYALEDYNSEDYFNCTEAAPDSNLVKSVYYDIFPDVLIDEYVLAYAASSIEADNAIEQSAVIDAVEANATLESRIAVEESIIAEVVEANATLESEIAIEGYVVVEVMEAVDANVTLESEIAVEEEDTMSEWSEEEDEDVINKCSEEASEDKAWVAGKEDLAIQDLPKSNAPFQEGTWIARDGVMTEAYAVQCTYATQCTSFEVENYPALHTPFKEGTGVAIEESREEAAETITTMITNPTTISTSLFPMWLTSTVIEATGDSTVPIHNWEAFFGRNPMVMLQECRTTLLTASRIFSLKWSDFGSAFVDLSTL